MIQIEVLKMLKSKIDEAGLKGYNYVIETSDIEAINQVLLLSDIRSFEISNRTYINLGFMDRIRVLFGKEVRLNIDIEVDKEVSVLKTDAKTTVAPFFKPKPNKNDFMQMTDNGCY